MPPERSPINLLSFSAWWDGRRCPLLLAFHRDPSFAVWRRSTPAMALGTVRHRLEEEVAHGAADDSPLPAREWFDRRWQELVASALDELAHQWAPAVVERPEAWEGYSRTRAALRSRLSEAIDERRRTASHIDELPLVVPSAQVASGTQPATLDAPDSHALHNPPRPGEGQVNAELTLVDLERGLIGRLDLVEIRDATVRVVDYKSLGGADKPPSERVRAQLLFYAGLVEAAWGSWPTLALARPGLPQSPLGYRIPEAQAIRAEAAGFRAAWNASGTFSDVAPSAARCAWCPMQAVCPSFAQFPTEFNADPRRVRAHSLAAGEVRELRVTGEQATAVVDQTANLTCSAGEVAIARLPAGLSVAIGDRLRVARLDRGGGESTVRASWDSLIHVEEM